MGRSHPGLPIQPEILRRWLLLSPYLDRRQRSLWAAAEATVIGSGGCALLAKITGLSSAAISDWKRKLQLPETALPGSLAKPPKHRAGRMPNEVKDPKMLPALELMLADEIAGDPMTDQRWVRSSLRNLSKNLKEKGHEACTHTVARMLRKTGYALQANRKKQVRAPHPDRDQQFKYIAELKKKFLLKGLPVISIDTKKKELIGNYRREGKSWRKEPIEVDSYFASYAQCVAVPFGIYDLGKNIGYVSVGISSNTAEFAVNSLVWWWQRYARSAYPSCDRILILADGGGGNGYNLRSWKKDLQDRLCDDSGLTVAVSHYPPGCSKWNPVEYRLFSQISINWAGRPLRDLNAMLAFIRGTTTSAGLKVEARLDQEIYRKGRKVTHRQLKELALRSHEVCPNWNYTLAPRRLGLSSKMTTRHFPSVEGYGD
jgi:Rhodopirellula transposase DDE domain